MNRQSERYHCAGIDLSLSTLADQSALCRGAEAGARATEAHVLAAKLSA
ncbi:hypothetical protein X770_30570 [Mesorhizobium sp. LSJC269B00]|nr:hypothetical protein X770_30570 [Mesorhizobium sp. LSJC269B00]